jgi:hypothetical protein
MHPKEATPAALVQKLTRVHANGRCRRNSVACFVAAASSNIHRRQRRPRLDRDTRVRRGTLRTVLAHASDLRFGGPGRNAL